MHYNDRLRDVRSNHEVPIERAFAGSRDDAQLLDGRALGRIESAFGVELGPVRLHDDEIADELCRAHGVDALTFGSDVFFRAGRYSPAGDEGLRLLAHEAAHVAQQARVTAPNDGRLAGTLEQQADMLAERAVRGIRVARRVDAGPRRVERPVRWLQGHGSWEHSLFGDASVMELMALAADAPDQAKRRTVLTTARDMLGLWQHGTASVTAAMLQERWSGRRLFAPMGGVLFTYGELNALPDYVPNPGAIGSLPSATLLKILQSVRQEGFNKIQGLLGPSDTPPIIGGPTALIQAWVNSAPVDFTGAASPAIRFSVVNLLLETGALDSVTASLGINRYLALVARNACHFAPFSWYRWRDAFTAAQTLARQSHATTDAAQRMALATQAWTAAGYAAHFLQDSFAAGHLVNKTLVMQWFVDWAVTGVAGHIPDWDVLLTMTAARQPGISAAALYDPSPDFSTFIAPVRDPQTAQEAGTRGSRMALSGTQPDGSIDELQAYINFLTFMGNPSAQAASGAVHDYFNQNSLMVASVAHPDPYKVWGDDTMLLGGLGIEIASETTHRSEVSIMELLETGQTDMTIDVIFSHFPTKAALPSGAMVGLHDWQFSPEVRQLVESTIFPTARYYATQLGPRLTNLTPSGLLKALGTFSLSGIEEYFDDQGRIPNISIDVGTGNQR